MAFRVVDRQDVAASPGDVLLVKDNWNDWYVWITQFYVIVIGQDGSRIEVGSAKIAHAGMTHQNARTVLPERFESLNHEWFSIGQSENYYETLNELGAEYRSWFLIALQDCAFNLSILDRNQSEEVLHSSLLRDIDQQRVRSRFHRLAVGNAILTPFAFKYSFPIDPRAPDSSVELTFRVVPDSRPPSNVHVLIGRNGVGKTRCFDLLSRTFLGLSTQSGDQSGKLASLSGTPFSLPGDHGFAGLVTVSFSPFDESGPLVSNTARLSVRYAYIGLVREFSRPSGPVNGESASAPEEVRSSIKGRAELADDFVRSVEACRSGARRARWAHALKVLEADPLFEEADISTIADVSMVDWAVRARELFRRLSSGHSVVLLTISKLVELVEERSLVLIDEPEGHLHPPLLSAFVRALSNLLIDRNGAAVIATHSPVVLQEVPKQCVWILSRSGLAARADRPELETFGENVGALTREVFGLEVVQTGFHRLISDAAAGRTYEQVLEFFGGQLGAEGRALARLLTLVPLESPGSEVDSE